MSPRWSETPVLQQARAEWAANARLRWGGGIAVAIAAVYVTLVLIDWRSRLHEDYQQESVRLVKTATLAGQQQWIARAQQARDLRRALEAQVPASATLGLAQAEAQSWIQELLRAFGGRDMNSQARAPVRVVADGDVWKVPVTVRGGLTSSQYLEMLRRIEGNERLIVVEQVTLDNQRRLTIEMTISAFYRVRDASRAQGSGNVAP